MSSSRRASPRASASRAVTRRVCMLAFPDVQILDVTGPLEVFSRTTRWLRDHRGFAYDAYRAEVIGLARGLVRTSGGVRIHAERAYHEVRDGVDTLLVAGGLGTHVHDRDPRLLRWLRARARNVRRMGSVCTGAFFLGHAGLLDGRRATTHWSECDDFARRFPKVRVEPDCLYVKEGSLCTSAGVTAGMDLALALVEDDHGRDVALAVARALVMFLQRPGGQSQFSTQLATQFAEREPVRDLQAWMADHPDEDLSVDGLARRVHLGQRQFARVFVQQVGMTPARYATSVRVETARRLLESGRPDLEWVRSRSGFGSLESMRRAFLDQVGVPPTQYRERFARRPGVRPPARAGRARKRRIS
jgi:transcriptional regulator GlxA family with amidase domain